MPSEPTPTIAELARAARAHVNHLGKFDRNCHKQMEYLEDVCVPCAEAEKAIKLEVCPRCGAPGVHNCTKMAGQKSSIGPLPMVDHDLGWPYTDPNVGYDC